MRLLKLHISIYSLLYLSEWGIEGSIAAVGLSSWFINLQDLEVRVQKCTDTIHINEMRFFVTYCGKLILIKTSYYLNGAIVSVQKMKSHEKYEKRSLNMEFKYTDNVLYNITLALADDRVRCIVHIPTQTLMLVKDFMHGAPC